MLYTSIGTFPEILNIQDLYNEYYNLDTTKEISKLIEFEINSDSTEEQKQEENDKIILNMPNKME